MLILIDGHNLIPKVRGLSLRMLDDEEMLIQLLQDYTRIKHKKLEVYFDNAPLDQAGTRRYGSISAHFVPQGTTADAAIINRVRKMGAKAREVQVVSSDRRIQVEIKACQARAMPSEEFSAEMEKAFAARPSGAKPDAGQMNAAELDAWLKLFQPKNKK